MGFVRALSLARTPEKGRSGEAEKRRNGALGEREREGSRSYKGAGAAGKLSNCATGGRGGLSNHGQVAHRGPQNLCSQRERRQNKKH